MEFQLHPNLTKKAFVIDLPLCRVLLEDEKNYPWVFLIPRRKDISRIMELEANDQLQLIKELDWAQKILWNEFNPTQLNVAALGNKTPQLHIHVIARYLNDPAWPNAVWDHPTRQLFTPSERENLITLLKKNFGKYIP